MRNLIKTILREELKRNKKNNKHMTLRELKQFINSLPSEMDDFTVVNGEFGVLDPEDEDSAVYRVDKPILMVNVDEENGEVVLLHQTNEDINSFIGGENS
jgi:hypothetical protein